MLDRAIRDLVPRGEIHHHAVPVDRTDERQRIDARAPVRDVHIPSGHQHDDAVVAHTPVDRVLPRAADEDVVAREPGERIVAVIAGYDVVERVADADERAPASSRLSTFAVRV